MSGMNFRKFADGLMAQVQLSGSDEDFFEVDEDGVIAVPRGVEPDGFQLRVMTPVSLEVVILQKEVGREGGVYHPTVYRAEGMGSFLVWDMARTIKVMRKEGNVWTMWHTDSPNRLDCWVLGENAELRLFQIGVVTHDNGVTWRLLGERIWEGQLFRAGDGSLVAKPNFTSWGPFLASRRPLFDDARFQRFLKEVKLEAWSGSEEELEPELDEIPEGRARMQWYIPFAGQAGQGIAILADGSSAWVHGADLRIGPDRDGVKRIRRNTLVRYRAAEQWGTKQGPPRLTGVSLA